MTNNNNPFRLPVKPTGPVKAVVVKVIEKLLSLDKLANYYDQRPNQAAENPSDHVEAFLNFTMDVLGADLTVNNPQALEDIPKDGSVIMMANHPLGGLEGVAMTRQLMKIRPDLKVLTNELLANIPEFADIFIGVDVLSQDARAKNTQGMRRVFKHLKSGGALLIYPAGMVSAINATNWKVEDRAWNHVVGKLARQFQATCVPFYVHGRNSKLFYTAGLIHPRLRTALLPRELVNKAGSHVSMTIGSPIAWKDIEKLDNADRVTAYLRTATDLLSHDSEKAKIDSVSYPPLEVKARSEDELREIEKKLESLVEHRLLQYRNFDVYCIPYGELGLMMDEIAIARERTFRAAGEGTGLETDSDKFDPHYLHLFIWDRDKNAIVGGYRMGLVDEIVRTRGVEGLYSRSLYKFDEKYINRLGQALEMGRSFVCPEYQRHPRALDLLWQGIGNWVARHPEYHTLFGCVSISREHSTRALAFLNDSLMESYRAEQQFLNDVRPVAPLKVRNKVWSDEVLKSLSNLTLINKLLGQCDPGKSVPILLRQYLALNGRFIGFSVNHGFNDSLDGLIMVDLRKTSIKYLQRYLGESGSETFIKQWRLNLAVA